VILLLVWACPATPATAIADEPSLDPHLVPLQPLLERMWEGDFKNSTPDKPVRDVMRWERALNGKAVRVLHSINDGAYGGETIYRWDDQQQAVTYHYFTTAGFMTTGKVTFSEGKLVTHEVVSGNASGAKEVRGQGEWLTDGTFRVTTEYLVDDKWQPGREVVYRENAAAKVRFK
jgi:hypothetical protein